MFIKYDPSTNLITAVTKDNQLNNPDWTPVAIRPSNQYTFIDNYVNCKYDPTNKAVIYPETDTNNTSMVNDNHAFLDGLNNKVKGNADKIDELNNRMNWQHLVQRFVLPDDFDYLNRNYGIALTIEGAKVVQFVKSGVFVLNAGSAVRLSDAPQGTDYDKGCMFKIDKLGDSNLVVEFTNSIGVYISRFEMAGNLQPWKQLITF